MSAAMQLPANNSGCLWSDAELVRAKALRREGYTLATVAATLNEEFGTQRTRHAVETKLLGAQRPVETRAADAARKAAKRLAIKAELVAEAAPKTTRRACLTCRDPFDSCGAANRICASCKASEVWR